MKKGNKALFSLRQKPHSHQAESQSQSQSQPNPQSAEHTVSSSEPEAAAPKKRGRKPGSTNARQDSSRARIESTLRVILGGAVALTQASGSDKIKQDGLYIAAGSDNLITSILNLCEQDKNVREFFLTLSTGSAYSSVAMASLTIIVPILANHNLIPPIFGAPMASPKVQQNGVVDIQNN